MYPWSTVSLSGGHPPTAVAPSAHLSPHLTAHMAPPCALQILPNGIARSPLMWTKQDVRLWLEFCSEDFSIEQVRPDKFDMNGKALCLLTRKDFMERDPSSGDLLYNALQRLLSAKNEMTIHSPLPGITAAFPHSLPSTAHSYKPHIQASPQNGIILLGTGTGTISPGAAADGGKTGSAVICSADRVTPLTSPQQQQQQQQQQHQQQQLQQHQQQRSQLGGRLAPVRILPQPPSGGMSQQSSVDILSVADPTVPDSVLSPAPTTDQESASSDADSVNNESVPYDRDQQGGPGQEGRFGLRQDSNPNNNSVHSPADNGHGDSLPGEEGMDMMAEDVSGGGDCRLLWEFIYQLLLERAGGSRNYVCWEGDGSDLVFRIVNPTGLAELWGHQKNRTNMTYEKLSRALRYYYKMNIIKKVPGKRLTYKFLQHPTKIQKGQRGAKPHCMRNLPPNPHQLAPNPTATSPQPPNPPTPQLSPEDPGSLSPARDDVANRISPEPQQASPAHLEAAVPRSLPPTPVHLCHAPMSRRSSLSPLLDERVRSSLKDCLQGRQMAHPKMESEEALEMTHPVLPKRHRMYLEMMEQKKRKLEEDQQQHPVPMMKCDYQEEPEDLSVKSAKKDLGYHSSSTNGNPTASTPPARYTPPSSFACNGTYPSHTSPSKDLALYRSGYPPHSFTPPSAFTASPSREDTNTSLDASSSSSSNNRHNVEEEGKGSTAGMAVSKPPQENGFAEAILDPSLHSTDSDGSAVKSEPLHAASS